MVIAWLSFLAHRVWTSANIDIVSRPQILTAPILVEGKLLIDPPRVEIVKVRYIDARIEREDPKIAALLKAGLTVTVYMRIDPRWDRTLDYLVPLVPSTQSGFDVWGAPREGGDPGPQGFERVYALTLRTREQFEMLLHHRLAK